MRKLYGYYFNSTDEDSTVEEGLEDLTDEYPESMTVSDVQEHIISFLSQTDDAYVDMYGVIHEVFNGNDQPFAYIFEVTDDDWTEVTGNTGYWLDDANNKTMPESTRAAIAKVYEIAVTKI